MQFTVSDGLHEVSQFVTFLIAPGNKPPTLLRPADRTVREGETLRIQLVADDLEAAPLRFSSNLLPGGASLDARTGLFEWTPTFFQHGVYKIPFIVSDGESRTVQTTTIIVLNVNASPEFEGLDAFQVQEGQKLRFRAFAFDPDNPSFVPQDRLGDGSFSDLEASLPTVSYTVSDLPGGASFEPTSGVFDWTPSFSQAGAYRVTFTATDDGDGTGLPLTTTRTVLLRVLNSNRTPQITAISDQQVKRGDVLEVPIQANDADGDPLQLSIAGLPRFATFTDHGDGTGLLRFAPGAGDRDHYTITVLASDDGDGGGPGAVLTASQDFVLTVPVPNEAPHLATIGDKVAVFGQALTFTITASDFDQDPLTFSAEGLPTGAKLTSGPAYGKATFTWTPAAADIGTYSITFQVQDSGNREPSLAELDRQTIHVVARASNNAPVLNPIGNRTITEGDSLVLQLSARDPDGDSLLLSAANLPLGATFDPVQGVLRWTPNLFQAGSYPGIVFSASDGNRASTETITIQVNNANQAPVLVPLPVQSGREGAPLQFTLIAADFDVDPLSVFPLTPLPAGARFDAATRQFQWTPTFDQAGTYTLRFGAQDPAGLRGTVDVIVRIDNVNRAPTLSVSNHSALVGQPLSFFVLGNDPDEEDRLTFAAENLLEGAMLDPLTGRFQWTPGPGQTGDFTVAFSVSDGQASVSRSALIRADIAPASPEVTLELTPSFAVVPGQCVLVHVQASSLADVKSLSLTLDGQSVTLDAQGRGSILAPATGRHVLEATATDADGLVGKASTILRVRDPQDTTSPLVTFAAGLDGSIVTTATDIRATIADSNLDSWVLERAPLGFGGFTTLAIGSTPLTDGVLATLDPAVLANGVYRVRLTSVDLGGRVGQTEIIVQVNRVAKLTQFRRTGTDLTVTLGGVSMDLVRSYDSLQADQSSSFGLGWRLANRDVMLQSDVPATGHEAVGLFNPFRIGTRVYLTLPDGRRVGFTFAPIAHQQIGVTFYTPAFVADPGVDYTLRSADALLTLANNQFFDLGTARAYNPASGLFARPEYTLTAPDGTTFYLSSARGVERQVMPNGTRLIYSDGGILASNGESVRFIRDAAGRLTAMIASDGREVLYNYDATGHLTKVDRLFSGEVTHFAYAADDAHRLSLVVAPDAQPSEVIRYAPNPVVEPITANLGGAFRFSSRTPTGSLAAGSVDRYAFVLRDDELQSTKSKRLLIGASVQGSGGFQPGVPTIAGHALITSRLTSNSAFALFAFDRAGFQVLEVAGRDALASGGYTLRLFVAGELTGDGLVDGQDSEQLVSALSSTARDADLDQSGTVDAADVHILASNFGFVANRPPLATNGSAKTHQDLEVRVALAGLASDPDGDPVYFHIVGAQHGTARLSGDGLSVQFTPDIGFTGQAGFQFVATDCFGTSEPATVIVQVSDAPLVALDFVQRNPRLQPGQITDLAVIGDFADELGVRLPGSYVHFSSTDSAASVSSAGRVTGLHDGFGAILVSRNDLQAATAFHIGPPLTIGEQKLALVGLDTFPDSVTLAENGGTRQLDIDIQDQTELARGSTGTQYFVSDPGVISVSADGLITAKHAGKAIVTVVHSGSEVLVPVTVETPREGPAVVGKDGGVVRGGGLQIAIAPGALARNVTVSIAAVNQGELPMAVPPPESGYRFAGAFRLNLGGASMRVPAQLAVPTPQLAPGTAVSFFRAIELPNPKGGKDKVWLEVESGIVDENGMARTTSEPFEGLSEEGVYALEAMNLSTIRRARAHLLAALPVATLSAFAAAAFIINPLVGGVLFAASVFAQFAVLSLAVGKRNLIIRQIPPEGLPVDTATSVQIDADKVGSFETTVFNFFDPDGSDPVILSSKIEIKENTLTGQLERKLVLTGLRFDRTGAGPSPTDPNAPPITVSVIYDVGGFNSAGEPRTIEVNVPLSDIDPPDADGNETLRADVPIEAVIGTSRFIVRRKGGITVPGPDGSPQPDPDAFVDSNDGMFDEPDGRFAFVALAATDQVGVITTAEVTSQLVANDSSDSDNGQQSTGRNELVARIPIGKDDVRDLPRWIALTNDNTRAYVTLQATGRVAVVDAMLLREVDTIPDDPMDPDSMGINSIKLDDGAQPFAIAIDKSNAYAYVTDRRQGTVYVLDLQFNSPTYHQQVATITLPDAPSGLRGLAMSVDQKQLFVAAPKQILFGGEDQSTDPGNIYVVDISDPTDKILKGDPFTVLQTITAGEEPYAVKTLRKDLVVFTNRLEDGKGVEVLKPNDSGNWEVKQSIPLKLGSDLDTFDVNNAQSIVFTSDLRYGFVAGYDRFIQGVASADPTVDPVNPAGGNIGVLRDPFHLFPEMTGRKGLVGAVRSIPIGFPDQIGLAPDGDLLYVSYKGANFVAAYGVQGIITELEHSLMLAPLVVHGTPTFLTDRIPLDDLIQGAVPAFSTNDTIDVKADFRIDNTTGGLFPIFRVPDRDILHDGVQNDHAPIATGFAPQGLAVQDNFITLLEPAAGTTTDDPTPTFKWDVRDPLADSILYVSVFGPHEGLFPSDRTKAELRDGLLPFVVDLNGDGMADINSDGNPHRILTKLIKAGDPKEFTLPNELALTRGQTYFWGVEAETLDGRRHRKARNFRVAPLGVAANPDQPESPPSHFASVTLITHGWEIPLVENGVPENLIDMAERIAGKDPHLVFLYDKPTGDWKPLVPGATIQAALGKPLVLLADWAKDSWLTDSGFSEAAADAFFASLVRLNEKEEINGKLFASPLHLIGYDRGAVVNSEIAQRLGTFFPSIPDLQMTTLDPHDFTQPTLDFQLGKFLGALKLLGQLLGIVPPLDDPTPVIDGSSPTSGGGIVSKLGLDVLKYGDYLDPEIKVWTNVTFADNYYQKLAPEVVPPAPSLEDFTNLILSGPTEILKNILDTEDDQSLPARILQEIQNGGQSIVNFFRGGWQSLLNEAGIPLTFTPNGRAIQGADLNIGLGASSDFASQVPFNRSGFTEDQIPGWQHRRVKTWYSGTIDLAQRQENQIFFTFQRDPIWRRITDRKFGAYRDSTKPWYVAREQTSNAPWQYQAPDTNDPLNNYSNSLKLYAPWEGIGEGWAYSVLGGSGGPLGRPTGGQRTSVQVDNTRNHPGDGPIPSVFNGDFDVSVRLVVGRFPPLLYFIPGWSFHNPGPDFLQLITNAVDNPVNTVANLIGLNFDGARL